MLVPDNTLSVNMSENMIVRLSYDFSISRKILDSVNKSVASS